MLNLFISTNKPSSAELNAQAEHNQLCVDNIYQYTNKLSIYELNTLLMSIHSLTEQVKDKTLKN